MQNFNFSRLLPYIIALGSFYILLTVFFYPQFFNNKTFKTHDVGQWAGMVKRSVDYKKTHHEEPLWNDAAFGGMPDYLTNTGSSFKQFPFTHQVRYPISGLFRSLSYPGLMWMSFFCFWILALSFRVNPYIALFGALGFGLTTYNLDILLAGHTTKFACISMTCLILAGLRLFFDKKYLLGAIIFSFSLYNLVDFAHYQIIYYVVFICGFFSINELIYYLKAKTFRPIFISTSVIVLILILVLSSTAGRLMLNQEYILYTTRGAQILDEPVDQINTNYQNKEGLDKEYAFTWSLGKIESLSLLFPHMKGWASSTKLGKNSESHKFLKNKVDRTTLKSYMNNIPLYFGNQPFVGVSPYAGIVFIFFFVLAFFILEKRHLTWMLIATITMLFFAWGKNLAWFNYFMFDYFPAFNKFRAVSMAVSMVILMIVLIAILALDKVYKILKNKKLKDDFKIAFFKKIKKSYFIVAGLSLLVLLSTVTASFSGPNDQQLLKQIGDAFLNAIQEDRKNLLRSDAWQVLLITSVIFGLIYFSLKKKIKLHWAFLGIAFIGLVEMIHQGKEFFYPEKFQKDKSGIFERKASAADQLILNDTSSYRVINLGVSPFNDGSTSYFHRSVGGYHPAKLRIISDLITLKIGKEINAFAQEAQNNRLAFQAIPVLSMLNTKYIKFNDTQQGIIRNPNALGSAWFVEKRTVLPSSNMEIEQLSLVDLAKEALIDGSDFDLSSQDYTVDSTTSVRLTQYSTRRLRFETTNHHDGFIVFSEIYYPKGWIAKIDGKPTKIYRTNYALRGIEVPKGNHNITMDFEPKIYYKALAIDKYGTYTFSILWTLSVVIFFALLYKNKK